jgi:hypothetical protein
MNTLLFEPVNNMAYIKWHIIINKDNDEFYYLI